MAQALASTNPPTVDVETPVAIARLDHISAGYTGRVVLRDVSLALNAGEIFVLMGPNGAGKTSLVRVLTGMLAPNAGRIDVGGEKRGAVRLVPQDIALYPWLTARENCIAFARMSGATWRDAAALADHALRLAGCDPSSRERVETLSGGYKRRVNIAAALIGNPRLLVLDEPTVGVDLDARRAIVQTILSLKALGLAILVVTHDFDDADTLADRAGFLFDGRMMSMGAPRDLLRDAFGARKRIDLVLAEPPDPRQRVRLEAIGATPTPVSTEWILFREISDWDAQAFLANLQADGLVIHELKLRDPGLESLYARLSAGQSEHTS